MSNSYFDRLESNLRQQLEILDKIYDSDIRYVNTGSESIDTDLTNNLYLEEQDELIGQLDQLDTEYDEIYAYLSDHRADVRSLDNNKRTVILKLNDSIQSRLRDVAMAESEARASAEKLLESKKNVIAQARKTVRVIRNNYSPNPGLTAADHSVYDILN